MKPGLHFGTGVALGLGSAYFVLASHASGLSCLESVFTSCGSLANYSFLYEGIILAYLAALDIALGVKGRKGTTFYEMERQRKSRRVGMIAMLVGAIANLLDLYVFMIPFYPGLILLAVGAALIFASRFMKEKPELLRNPLLRQ